MKPTQLFFTTILALVVGVTSGYASDPAGVYARIDRIVLEPTSGAPETVQIWGVFSLARPNDPNGYLPPARGYLYFKLADNHEAARKEWTDLKDVAGTGQIVSFGSRYQLRTHVRPPGERIENPDPYVVSIGLTKVHADTSYPPVRALIDFRD